jgi:glycosyltransferase involved in cell wall biosynthesis
VLAKNIFQKLYHRDLERAYSEFSGIIFDNVIGDISDLQNYFENVHKEIPQDTKILISYHNHLWEPILELASTLNLRKKMGLQNWLDENDLKNILKLSGFEIVKTQKRFFGITYIIIARPIERPKSKNYSVSIIIPARNEEGNIAKIIPSIPKFGKWQQIIFVEGHSKDQTWEIINKQILSAELKSKSANNARKSRKQIRIYAYKQQGKGKADAVWLGFEKAKGEILMIYDADRTVDAGDLRKFFDVLASHSNSFANGSRLVYPMENQAMQTLNKLGNKVFSIIFSWILGQRFKDTLCGTKALFRKDYLYMRRRNKKYFQTDPFGDFALIFGAVKNKLKVIEVPVRYKERDYGSTNISRFRHGLLLLKMTWRAFLEFKL